MTAPSKIPDAFARSAAPPARRGVPRAAVAAAAAAAAAVAVVALGAAVGRAQPGDAQPTAQARQGALAYTYSRAAGYRYDLTLDQRSRLTFGAREDTPTSVVLKTRLDVRGAERALKPGQIGLVLTFGDLKADLAADGSPLEAGRFDQALRRTEINWVVDRRGHEHEFIIGATSPQRAQLLSLLRDGFLRTLPVFPEGDAPLRVGQQWTRTLGGDAKPPQGVPAIDNRLTITHTVASIDTDAQGRRVAKIASSLELTVTGKPERGGEAVAVTAKSAGSAVSLFDVDLGAVREHSVTMKGATQLKGPGGASASGSDLTLKMTLSEETP